MAIMDFRIFSDSLFDASVPAFAGHRGADVSTGGPSLIHQNSVTLCLTAVTFKKVQPCVILTQHTHRLLYR